MVRPKDLLGHAIHTTEITAVCDGNSQVAQGTMEGVNKGHWALRNLKRNSNLQEETEHTVQAISLVVLVDYNNIIRIITCFN